MSLEEGLFNQFVLDAPRVDVAVNERRHPDPHALFEELRNAVVAAFPDDLNEERRDHALSRLVFYCTQNALADFFQEVRDALVSEVGGDLHLVDGGRETIRVDTLQTKCLTLEKPFKVINFDGENNNTLFAVTLYLTYDIMRDTISSQWCRSPLTEPGWVLIETNSEHDFDLADLAVEHTAHEIAVNAARRLGR